MRAMRSWGPAVVGGALFVAGCQLIAGVRTDAALDEGSGGSGSGGSGGSGGKECSVPSDCPSGVCQDGGVCQPPMAKCTLDLAPFDILTAADLGGHAVEAFSLLLVSGPERAYVAVIDKVASRLVVGTVRGLGEPNGSKAEFPFTEGAAFVTGRESGGQLILHGRVGYEIGQVVFPTTPDGVAAGGMFQPFPTLAPACAKPNVAESMAFASVGDKTLYAATCAAPGGSLRALVVGGSAEPTPTLVAEGPRADTSLNIHYYTVTNGQHLLLLDDIMSGQTFFRTGASAADLAVAKPIQFSQNPAEQESVFGAVPLPTGDGVTLLLVHFTPPPMLSLVAEAGIVKNLASLAQVPPPGFAPIFTLADVSQFSPPSPVVGDSKNLYLTLTPPSGKTVNLNWFTPEGGMLLPNSPVFTLPDSDSGLILNSAVAQVGFKLLVAWIEQRDGAVAVRGQRLLCTL
jgi:hypothetical protein